MKAPKPCQVIQMLPNKPSMTSFIQPSKKYSGGNPRQKKITEALVMFITHDLISLSVVDSGHFCTMMNDADPNYQVPSRKFLSSKLLKQKFEEVQSSLKQQLNNSVNHLCLTVDIWSSRQMRSYLGITGHFINDFSLHSIMLGSKRFHGSHK